MIAFSLHMLGVSLGRNERAIAIQRALADVGNSLLAARSQHEIFSIALEGAGSLVTYDTVAWAALLLPNDLEVCTVASTRGPGTDQLLGYRLALADLDLTQLVARMPPDGPGTPKLVAPVLVEGRLVAVLAAGGPGTIPADSAGALEAVVMATVLSLGRLEASQRFESLVQNSNDVFTVVSPDARIGYQSPSFARLTGRDPAATIGTPVFGHVHLEDRPVLAACFNEATTAPTQLALRWPNADGTWRQTETIVSDLRDDPGVRGWVLNIRDVTERYLLEAELRHAQKLESVGQLAAGIAHEINTPIQFVGDNVRFLGEAFEDLVAASGGGTGAAGVDLDFLAKEVPLAIDQTLDGVERVATIVRAMKAFGHPSGECKAPADLNQAVRDTLVVANNTVRYVADVVTELTELPPVWCHLSDINQVLLNLVVNAAQAVGAAVEGTGERGTITVRSRCEGDEVVIEVADTGVGIPPEIADRIFEPFFTTKDVGIGTGQGLTLAYSLIRDRHHGTIGFRSEPGAGTTFTVRLPLEIPTQEGGVTAG